MPPAHISQDISHIICLTSYGLSPDHLFVDQCAQLAQQVGTEEGPPRTDCHRRIGRMNIGPFDRQRAQPPFCVQIRHTVPAPVVAHNKDFESLSPQRMKRVRDSENFCAIITTVCNARFSPRPKWKPEYRSLSAGYSRLCGSGSSLPWPNSTRRSRSCLRGSTSVPFASVTAAAAASLNCWTNRCYIRCRRSVTSMA